MRPSEDCTALNATSAVSGPTASAIASSGAKRTLRSARTTNGLITEAKSPSGHSTSAPAGSEAETRPTWPATVEPTATRSDGTPTSRAKESLARCTRSKSPDPAGSPAPAASARARTSATAERGRTQQVAVFR